MMTDERIERSRLIYIAHGQGRHDDARALAEEARAIAEAAGAPAIMRQVEEAAAQNP